MKKGKEMLNPIKTNFIFYSKQDAVVAEKNKKEGSFVD
jgi:hypothetical protein